MSILDKGVSNMFGWLKKDGGYVRALGLSKFWKALTTEERELVKQSFAKTFYPHDFDTEQVDGKAYKIQTDLSASDFLFKTALKLTGQKYFLLAEKCLNEAAKREKDVVKKHEILNELLEVYYKQRSEREDAIAKCITICEKDISLAPHIIVKEKDMPSFKRLAIILENERKYEEAIRIAELALSYGLSDGTKGGYEGRIEKLKTKLAS